MELGGRGVGDNQSYLSTIEWWLRGALKISEDCGRLLGPLLIIPRSVVQVYPSPPNLSGRTITQGSVVRVHSGPKRTLRRGEGSPEKSVSCLVKFADVVGQMRVKLHILFTQKRAEVLKALKLEKTQCRILARGKCNVNLASGAWRTGSR